MPSTEGLTPGAVVVLRSTDGEDEGRNGRSASSYTVMGRVRWCYRLNVCTSIQFICSNPIPQGDTLGGGPFRR